jgi:hypothetical protein
MGESELNKDIKESTKMINNGKAGPKRLKKLYESRSNFSSQKNFPIFAWGEDEGEEGEEYYEEDLYEIVKEQEDAVKDLNGELEYYSVELKPGYYDGVQLYIDEDERSSYYDYWWDNYGPKDVQTNCGGAIEPTEKDIKEAKERDSIKIYDFAEKWGFAQYKVSWRASNGETGYKEINENTQNNHKLNEGTSNFWSQDNFPIFALGENWGEGEDDIEEEIYELRDEIEDLDEELEYYSVELKPGYYQGVQLYVDEDERDSYYNYWWNNIAPDDAILEPYGDIDPSEKDIEESKKRDSKKIFDFAKKWEFSNYGVAYQFDNGETGYSKIE